MTPEQKLKRAIITTGCRLYNITDFPNEEITQDNIDRLFDEFYDFHDGAFIDGINEVRCSGTKTELPCDYSSHYESHAVAAQMFDGSWVGWTYFHGGGKHGCPEEMEWMSDAYDVEVTEEEKIVKIKTFTKKGSGSV